MEYLSPDYKDFLLLQTKRYWLKQAEEDLVAERSRGFRGFLRAVTSRRAGEITHVNTGPEERK